MADTRKKGLHTVTRKEQKEFERQLQEHRMNVLKRTIIAAVVILLFVGGTALYMSLRRYTGYDIRTSVSRADTKATQFEEFQGNILKYSNDGAIKDEIRENYGCRPHRIRIEYLDKIVNSYIDNLISNPEFKNFVMDNVKAISTNKVTLEDELIKSKQSLEKLQKQYKQIYEDKLNDLIPEFLFKDKKQELDKKIKYEETTTSEFQGATFTTNRKIKTVIIMLKTNSKEVKTTIKNFIMDNIEDFFTEREIKTDKPATTLWQIVEEEKFYNDDRYKNNYDKLYDWLQGLGCGIGDDIFLSDATELIGNWLKQTEGEKARYTNTQAEELACKLVYRELMAMIRKEEA